MGFFDKIWGRPQEESKQEKELEYISLDKEKANHLGVGECIVTKKSGKMRCVLGMEDINGKGIRL